MGFKCPNCSDYTLKITQNLDLPPDRDSDEISIQIIKCLKCNLETISVYKESRRGNLNEYSYQHTGYMLPQQELNKIKRHIRYNPKCFETYDESHRWIWINSQNPKESFPIINAPTQ